MRTLEVYSPFTNSWSTGPDLPTARGGIAGAIFDGQFVVVGGEGRGSTFSQVEAYDPLRKKWTSLPPLPTARHGLAAVSLDGKLYVIGGGERPGLYVSGKNEVLEMK